MSLEATSGPRTASGAEQAVAQTTPGVVLVPVKTFDAAKSRLQGTLTPDQRASLAERMATHVVLAQTSPVAIACDDQAVADWAAALNAQVVWCPGTNLNGAIEAGYRELSQAGFGSIAVAHSDLPRATSLEPLLAWTGITIVPDRHRTGTNVMVLPPNLDFVFAYGAGSYPAHVAEAVRHQRGLRIVHDADLGWDIDHPDDLEQLDRPVEQLLRKDP